MNCAVIFLLIVNLIFALVQGLEASVVSPDQETLTRHRRQLRAGDDKGSVGLKVEDVKGVGTVATGDIQRNLWEGDRGRLDAKAAWNQVINGPQRGTSGQGGSLTYSDNKGAISAAIDRQKDFGTKVGVDANRNIWTSRNRASSLDAQGSWSKVISGPAQGRPNVGGFLTFTHRF